MRVLLLMVLLGLTPFATGETDDMPGPETTTTEREIEADVVETDVDAADEEPPEPQRAMREGNLSDAFKNFKPSEEISADNAVSFPVDI